MLLSQSPKNNDGDASLVSVMPFRHGALTKQRETAENPAVVVVTLATEPVALLLAGAAVDGVWTSLIGVGESQLCDPWYVVPHGRRLGLVHVKTMFVELDHRHWEPTTHTLAASALHKALRQHGGVQLECVHERVRRHRRRVQCGSVAARSCVCVCRLSRVECQMLPRVVYVALKTLPAPMEPAPVAVPLTIAADAPMVRRVQLELFCAWRECEPMA